MDNGNFKIISILLNCRVIARQMILRLIKGLHYEAIQKKFKLCFASVSIVLLLCLAFCFSGCDADKQHNLILFNKDPITKENLLKNSTMFETGKRIYYIFISEQKISSNMVRIRVLKREEKANYELSKVAYSNDFRLYKDQVYYYNDYFVIHESGYYCMAVYSMDKLDRPMAVADFRVK